MSVSVLHFDVFTTVPGKGNPAGIVLDADGMSTEAMQELATRTGFPDTAFVSSTPEANFRIRYFSTRREVELCGHATVAAAIALHTSRLNQELPAEFSLSTNAGILRIRLQRSVDGGREVVMSQARSQFKPFIGDLGRLAEVLGIGRDDVHPTLPVMYGSTGRWTLVVPVRSLDVMRRMVPSPAQFSETLLGMPSASIHPFCLEVVDTGAHMHARHFSSPCSGGAAEDAVTGTASGVLGAYYRTFIGTNAGLVQPLVIEQGWEIGREGRVLVWAEPGASGGYEVRIAGSACFVGVRSC